MIPCKNCGHDVRNGNRSDFNLELVTHSNKREGGKVPGPLRFCSPRCLLAYMAGYLAHAAGVPPGEGATLLVIDDTPTKNEGKSH